MKLLSQLILEHNYEQILNTYWKDKLKIAMTCWTKFDNNCDWPILSLLESSKYNFTNCGKVIKKVVDYVDSLETFEEHSKEFDCSDLEVFFKKLSVEFTKRNRYLKTENDIVHITISLPNKSYSDYDVKEHKRLVYNLIHELTHAYEDYLVKKNGQVSIIDIIDQEYVRKYNISTKWISTTLKDDNVLKNISRCKYYLDKHEKFAYLGTIEETVKNIYDKVNPTYFELKFDEILELFSEEYIWKEYIHLNTFLNNLDKVEDKKLKESYYVLFHIQKEAKEIRDELLDGWEDFQREFVEAFIEAYDECSENIVPEGMWDPEILENPFDRYD